MRKFGLIVFLAIFAISGLQAQPHRAVLNGRYCMIAAKDASRSTKKSDAKKSDTKMCDKEEKSTNGKELSPQPVTPQPMPQVNNADKTKEGNAQKTKLDVKPDEKKSSKVWVWILLLLSALVATFVVRKRKNSKRMKGDVPKILDGDAAEKPIQIPPIDTPLQTPQSVEMPDQLVIAAPVTEDVLDQPADEHADMPSTQLDNIEPELSQVETHACLTPQEGAFMAADAGLWIVVGASVQGNGHRKMELPCQDNHGYEYLGDGWGIAIVSDGAGSAKYSHMGSAATVARAMFHFKDLIEQKGWKQKGILPTEGEWLKLSYQMLKKVHDEIAALAAHNHCEPKDLNATLIVLIHTPLGLLVVHVGDGRAGYRDMDGHWLSLITPHKGEEANQTIFMESNFWNIPFFEMSGVLVPESVVLLAPVSGFALMSDGCESTSWLCNQFNEETKKYYDPNVPFDKFFEPLMETLFSFRNESMSLHERGQKWYAFIKEGNHAFIKETDDKTMILAALHQPNEPERPSNATEHPI